MDGAGPGSRCGGPYRLLESARLDTRPRRPSAAARQARTVAHETPARIPGAKGISGPFLPKRDSCSPQQVAFSDRQALWTTNELCSALHTTLRTGMTSADTTRPLGKRPSRPGRTRRLLRGPGYPGLPAGRSSPRSRTTTGPPSPSNGPAGRPTPPLHARTVSPDKRFAPCAGPKACTSAPVTFPDPDRGRLPQRRRGPADWPRRRRSRLLGARHQRGVEVALVGVCGRVRRQFAG